MSPEFRFLCNGGGAPAASVLGFTRSDSRALFASEDESEFVEFDVSDQMVGQSETEHFARLLCQRIMEDAADRLTVLRAESTAIPSLSPIAADLKRIANHFDPPPPDKVGSEYVAQRLGCTTTWIADRVRQGEIPRSCIVPGTGNGKLWKFHRHLIDKWIESR